MKRLLCIAGSMDAGGAETFLMKIYRKIDKANYQMDFYVLTDKPGFYDKEIQLLGGRIYHGTAKSDGFLTYARALKRVVQENHYDYVLRMSQNSLSALDLMIAKYAGAKCTVFRSTNSHVYGGQAEYIVHRLFRPIANKIIDVKIAPSKEAAVFMFGRRAYEKGKVTILNNGIDLDTYRFDFEKRDAIRNELGITDKFVIGHIGRFNFQKNHTFLFAIYKEVLQKRKDAVLLLLGAGECETNIKALVHADGLDDKVFFLGVKRNTPDYYSAMDFFVFPSLYEGMPNTVIEAQASGLPCIISEAITKDVQIIPSLSFESLQKTAVEWADTIIKKAEERYNRMGKEISECFMDKGFAIEEVLNEFTALIFGVPKGESDE